MTARLRWAATGTRRQTGRRDERQNLNPNPAPAYQAADFGFYNATDTPVFAPAGAVSVSGRTATVDFLTTPQIETATRFFINAAGAVQDRPQTVAISGLPLATPSSPDVLNKGGPSQTRPEMLSARPIGAQDFKIEFNTAIQLTAASAAGFLAVTDDGTFPAAATAIGSGGTANSVIVTFPTAVAEDPGGIVRVFLSGGSVTTVGGALTNLGGEVPTSTPNSTPNSTPGFTNGPDLLSVGVDTATSRVVYVYDEAVQATPPASAFQGAAADGAPINALGGVVVSGNTVTALFPSSVGSAVLFANPFNTLTDRTGRPNPHQSVSRDVEAGPAPPQTPPSRPAPPVATKPNYKTTVTLTRRGRAYSGAVKSARKGCRKSRRVILRQRGSKARFGTAFTNKKGKFTIKRKKRLKGRVYVTVTARTTSDTCLAGKSKSIRG